MSRRYDTRTTIFSPDGRLFQVEYAMDSVGHAATCLGVLAQDGVVLTCEKRNTNKLLDDTIFKNDKIYWLNDNIAVGFAGLTSDANVLINELRLIVQRYYLKYQEDIPVEQVVVTLCDIKQAYTQFGGKRPFGVSILFMGWDKHYGFQLYQTDPSGNYSGWKATCIGSNASGAISMLKQEYKGETISVADAKSLCIKILCKSLDITKLTSEKVEMVTLMRSKDKTCINTITSSELTDLIKKHDESEQEEKKRKEGPSKS